jgi:hypothetical protein
MIALGAVPESTANIGRGVASSLSSAAMSGGKQIMDASTNTGSTYGNLAYNLGGNIGSGRLFGNTPSQGNFQGFGGGGYGSNPNYWKGLAQNPYYRGG